MFSLQLEAPLTPRRRPEATGVPGLMSFFRLMSLCAVLALLWGGLPGCGGDGGDDRTSRRDRRSQDEPSDDVDDESGDEAGGLGTYRRRAEEYLEKAEQAGADELFSDEFERAQRNLERASDLRRSGDLEDAERQYRMAANRLKSLIGQAEDVEKARQEAQAVRAEVDAEKSAADEAKAQDNAPDVYEDAMRVYKEGIAALGKSDTRAIEDAKRKLRSASDLFGQAAELAKSNALERERALKEKERMLAYKKRAREAGVDTKEISLWQRAESEELRGDTNLKGGDFQYAAQAYQSAMQQYTAALESVLDEEKYQKFLAEQVEQRKKEAELLAKQQAELLAKAQQPPPIVGTPSNPEGTPPSPGVVPRPAPPPSGSQPTPEAVDAPCLPAGFDPSAYPHEIDDEDEAFLLEHYDKISKYLQYDPATGGVVIDYSDGKRLKAESKAGTLLGNINNVRYEDIMLQGRTADDPAAWISFEGHTAGFMIIAIPLRYVARVTYEMNVGLMDASGKFGVNLMVDPRRKNWYGTTWVHLSVVRGGLPKGGRPVPAYRKSANYWFPKTRPVQMVTEYFMPDPEEADKGATESGIFRLVYDLTEENLTNQVPAKAYTRGYVAIEWSRVKFRLRNLKICGILDKETAVAMLRKKLNMPKPKKKATDQPPEEEGKEENPTSPEEPETDDTAKEGGEKTGGDFDF